MHSNRCFGGQEALDQLVESSSGYMAALINIKVGPVSKSYGMYMFLIKGIIVKA